jgi:hypothetical protein
MLTLNRFTVGLTAAALALVPTSNAHAALITGVTASSNMGAFSSGVDIQNTVNGAGLPGNTPNLIGNHAVGTSDDVWVSQILTTTGTIDFNLNGSYNLAGLSFWNFNTFTSYGIKDVLIQVSTDGFNFATVSGAPTQFAIADGFVPTAPQQVAFAPVLANYVRFSVLSNYGNEFGTGFAEVQFDGTPVTPIPTPALLPGLIGMGVAALRQRKTAAAEEA